MLRGMKQPFECRALCLPGIWCWVFWVLTTLGCAIPQVPCAPSTKIPSILSGWSWMRTCCRNGRRAFYASGAVLP